MLWKLCDCCGLTIVQVAARWGVDPTGFFQKVQTGCETILLCKSCLNGLLDMPPDFVSPDPQVRRLREKFRQDPPEFLPL